jgi:hypothetical protein
MNTTAADVSPIEVNLSFYFYSCLNLKLLAEVITFPQ